MNKSVYFIILNYNTTEDTKKCVRSICELDTYGYDIKIVIIDNNSPDNSYNKLLEHYSNDHRIKIIKMERNIGFSKANNAGYRLAAEDITTEFCVVCNSDIIFAQKDFVERIEKEYFKSHFHILGPDIWCEAMRNTWCHGHQSPWYHFETKASYVKMHLKYNKLKLDLVEGRKNSLLTTACIKLKRYAWLFYRKIVTNSVEKNYRMERHEKAALHGSCIIVSSRFTQAEDYLFYPEVFFYGEELLLYLRVIEKNYISVYNPELRVQHMQGRATDTLDGNTEKEKFVYENLCIGDMTYLREKKRYS